MPVKPVAVRIAFLLMVKVVELVIPVTITAAVCEPAVDPKNTAPAGTAFVIVITAPTYKPAVDVQVTVLLPNVVATAATVGADGIYSGACDCHANLFQTGKALVYSENVGIACEMSDVYAKRPVCVEIKPTAFPTAAEHAAQ